MHGMGLNCRVFFAYSLSCNSTFYPVFTRESIIGNVPNNAVAFTDDIAAADWEKFSLFLSAPLGKRAALGLRDFSYKKPD